MGEDIYIIGGIGYGKQSEGDKSQTQVFRLSTKDFSMHKLEISGKSPGWICRHRSSAISDHEIVVHGGGRKVLLVDDGEIIKDWPMDVTSDFRCVLNIRSAAWEEQALPGF